MFNIQGLPKYLRFAYEDAIDGGVDPEIVNAIFEAAARHRADRDNWPHKRMTDAELAARRVLYKYREVSNLNHWKILLNQELWFPHPSTFNDPFDSQLLVRFDLMSPKQMDAFIKEEILRIEPTAGGFRKSFLMSAMKTALLNPIEHDAAVQKWMQSKLNKTKILCLGLKKNNILMWSHYAQSHKGFAIGFDAVKLNKLCFENGGYQTGYVAYRDKYPILRYPETEQEKMDFITTLMNVKSRIWKYEKEVRITLFNAPNKVSFSTELILELVIGCDMENKCQTKLLKIADSQYPNAAVYKAVRSRDTFSLNFEKLR